MKLREYVNFPDKETPKDKSIDFVNADNVPYPKEWDKVGPKDYLLDNYNIKVEKDEEGNVNVKITGWDNEKTSKSGIGFRVNKNIPYAITTQHIKSCWRAMFRHQIKKVLKEKDDGKTGSS